MMQHKKVLDNGNAQVQSSILSLKGKTLLTLQMLTLSLMQCNSDIKVNKQANKQAEKQRCCEAKQRAQL